MARMAIYFIVLVVLVDAALSAKPKDTSDSTSDSDSDSIFASASSRRIVKRKKKRSSERSTSSSSGALEGSASDDSGDSLPVSGSTSSGKSNDRDKRHWPKSSDERKGWRKWHRKCTRCPEDARKKWRDPTIQWICGAYQRARRSFKSKCMMEYRNCQDGTMFVKIHNYRCANESSREDYPHGEHFFYEYKVVMTDDSSNSKDSSSTEDSRTESSTEY